jgi:hypothetical protein
MSDTEHKTLFAGELQLTAWGDSSTTGPWVKFWLHPDDLEQFKLLRQRKGNKEAGTRLGAVMVEINDDETIVTQEPTPKPNTYSVRIGDLARCAVFWCERPDFWQWASETSGLPILDRDDAKDYILSECGVFAKYGKAASRKHLDADAAFSNAFLERILRPFKAYADENGIDLNQKYAKPE